MTYFFTFLEWLNIRPTEVRRLILAVAGSFLILSFVILTRSLREALFLASFHIRQLPWMTAAVVIIGLPAVGIFSRLLSSYRPLTVLRWLTAGIAVGLIFLWATTCCSKHGVIILYLWTAIGTLLLTSGFWVVISNQFPLRGAKRLFGLIGAGGTAGAMAMGISLAWITDRINLPWLILAASGLLVLFFVVLCLLQNSEQEPAPAPNTKADTVTDQATQETTQPNTSMAASIRLLWSNTHLRTIAYLVFIGTLMTTFLDYQFKDQARLVYTEGADLAGFFGVFYGWAGFITLLLQIFLAGRLLEKIGVGKALSIAPTLIILGCLGLFLVPGLALVTLVRGTDYSLRKAIYRPTVELLYLPVPVWLRNRTKTIIDSLVDSLAEGIGALLILLVVSWLGLTAKYLAILTALVAIVFLFLSRIMSHSYFQSISSRLREEESRSKRSAPDVPSYRDLLSATFTSLDLSSLRSELKESNQNRQSSALPAVTESPNNLLKQLSSSNDQEIIEALASFQAENPDHIEAITHLMARDNVFRRIVHLLQRYPDDSTPPLVEMLLGKDTDFVIRRRIPDVLAKIGGSEADEALIEVLTSNRFEVRYRAAIALVTRRKLKLPKSQRDWRTSIWHAISMEVRRERPLWELQKLLDNFPLEGDDLVTVKVGVRGELSLEHTFRLLTLVLDPQQVRAAYHGVITDDPQLKSFALEFLEHVLPQSIRHRLWLFIGDVSEKRKKQQLRSIDAVVADMMVTDLTLFGGELSKSALKNLVSKRDQPQDEE